MTTTYPPETTNGVVTSWIPLTTGWTDTSDCSSNYVVYKYYSLSRDFNTTSLVTNTISDFFAFDPLWDIFYGSTVTCLPSEIVTWRSQLSYDSGTWLELSLLTRMSLLPLTCPDAWSTVATFVKSGISTQVMCCPPSYWLSNTKLFSTGVEGVCMSKIDSGADVVIGPVLKSGYLDIQSGADIAIGSELKPGYLDELDSSNSKPQFIGLTTIESDITAQAASVIGWNVLSIAPPTASPTQTSSPPSADGSRINSGVKAGIGVSVGVGTLIVISLIAWAIILKRRTKRLSAELQTSQQSRTQPNGTASADGVFNLSQSCDHCNSRSHELDHENMRELGGSQINELSHRSLCELDSAYVPVEISVATPKSLTVRRGLDAK